ncbi:MAG: zinc ribbon domain-containing protein [Coriobacteriia bacterium]|nr:zinc ribbon domain-containing protein [Coriobacteriia bacterium]
MAVGAPVAADPAQQAYQAPPAPPAPAPAPQAPPAQAPPAYQAPPAQQPYQQDPAQQGYQAPPQNDVEANKGMAILAYIIFFIPLIAGTYKTSPFVKFHTNQAIILVICNFCFMVAMGILITVLALTPLGFLSFFISILYFAPLVFVIIGIVNAASGKFEKLPLIGELFNFLK